MPGSHDDLQADSNLKRIDALEGFRKDFEGEKFYERVMDSLKKSKEVDAEIKSIAWATIREKIVWVLLGGVALILIDILKDVIPHLISSLFAQPK